MRGFNRVAEYSAYALLSLLVFSLGFADPLILHRLCERDTTGACITSTAGGRAVKFGLVTATGAMNDALPEAVVGEPAYAGPNNKRGRVRVYSLQTGDALYGLAGALTDGSESFGYTITIPGDCDNDGFDDIFVGAPQPAMNAGPGRVYGFSGRDGTALQFPLGGDMVFVGSGTNDQFGTSLASGNLDGVGAPEVIIGANQARTATGYGYVRAFHCDSGAQFGSDFTMPGAQGAEYFGSSVAAVDLNGDGIDEIAAGAPGADFVKGKVFFRSSTSTPIPPIEGLIRTNQGAYTAFAGSALAAGGDSNLNNKREIVVTSRTEGNPMSHSIIDAGSVKVWELGGSVSSPTWVLVNETYGSESHTEFGTSIATTSFNLDDHLNFGANSPDILIGIPMAGSGLNRPGAIKVLKGIGTGSSMGNILWSGSGPVAGSYYGSSVSGQPDLLVGLSSLIGAPHLNAGSRGIGYSASVSTGLALGNVMSIGAGCSNTSPNRPTLSVSGNSMSSGNTATLSITTNSQTMTAGIGVVYMSPQNTFGLNGYPGIPLFPLYGCNLYLSNMFGQVPFVVVNGVAQLQLPLSANLRGFEGRFQAAFINLQGELGLTNAIDFAIG